MTMDCPNCRKAMAPHGAERLYGNGTLAIDLCRQCLAAWFDDKELLQLSPAAAIQLLAEFAKEGAGTRVPLQPSLACPRCARQLVETHDRQRNTRFWYHRCPAGHGRFMTSYQFLRAKDFVRTLSETEMAELRQHIRQVSCANCGAPVDLERDAICGFCRTPVAIIDPDQVRRLLEQQRRTEVAARADGPDPTLPLTIALERLRAERAWAAPPAVSHQPAVLGLVFGNAADPIAGGLRALARLLRGQ
jgi:hypothetical protein